MKQMMSGGWICFVISLAGLCGADRSAAAADEAAPEKVFVGYLYGQPRNINFRLYTHLCHAFVTADAEGDIQKSGDVPNREIVGQAHKAGVKVMLSLGGWGWDKQFAAIVSKQETEERYARAVIEMVDSFDYDGIDLDWEYPDTEKEVVGFERLSRRFRNDLDAIGLKKKRRMVLTMAASSNKGTLKWLSKEFLVKTMDWINVMTYDYAGDWTDYAGHHSPLFASSKQPAGQARSTEMTMTYLLQERGFPARMLAVGLPLYGRGFAVSEPYASTKNATKIGLPQGNYRNLNKLEHDQGWTRLWDDETKNPWLIARDRSAVIGYDDVESISIKTEWAMSQGFRGVFFWEIGADLLPDGTNPLQEASHKKWEKSLRPDGNGAKPRIR